jgi:hypothetical protein
MPEIAAINQVVIQGRDETGPATASAVANLGRVGAPHRAGNE